MTGRPSAQLATTDAQTYLAPGLLPASTGRELHVDGPAKTHENVFSGFEQLWSDGGVAAQGLRRCRHVLVRCLLASLSGSPCLGRCTPAVPHLCSIAYLLCSGLVAGAASSAARIGIAGGGGVTFRRHRKEPTSTLLIEGGNMSESQMGVIRVSLGSAAVSRSKAHMTAAAAELRVQCLQQQWQPRRQPGARAGAVGMAWGKGHH